LTPGQAALRTLGLPANDAYMDEIMRQYDANRDGSVDFGEFRRYVAAKEAAIRAAFGALDVDADGEVSQAELTTAMRRVQTLTASPLILAAMRRAVCAWQALVSRLT